MGNSCLPRRCGRLIVAGIVFLTILGFLYTYEPEYPAFLDLFDGIPPSYSVYHEYERNLPQHNLSLPAPEGRHAKYFWVRNHVHASGWGNAMQELLLNSYLAYTAKRSFVFDNYTWDRDGPEFSEYRGKLIPSRIPLSAIIAGPTIGDPYPEAESVPRAVSKNYFNEVCPSPTVINSSDPNEVMSGLGADGIVDKWVKKLNSIDDPCVEVDINSFQIFGVWVFGTPRILPIWPSLSKSPMITQFAWSSLVFDAFQKNMRLLGLPSRASTPPNFPVLPADNQYAPIPGLLVLHIRRGDFVEHCTHFANWSSTWNGFNSFPSFLDKFSPPPGGGGGHTTPENTEVYLKHCFPSIERIVQKVMEIRTTPAARNLENVYIMTNGSNSWIKRLKKALRQAAKWDTIVSSNDIKLSKEQKYVAQAVDMLIGQKAQVFVGNGFSSLSSNVVMLRISRNYPPDSNRFW